MPEYIERENLAKEGWYLQRLVYGVGYAAIETKKIIDIPVADVRPVVRGRDICDTVDGHCEFKCSVCGVELSSVYGGNNDFGLDGGYFNFCPNCGATMKTRARWIPNVPPRDLRPRCSACGELNPTEEITCPNCGADMREES